MDFESERIKIARHVNYGYDPQGRLTSTTDWLGNTITYGNYTPKGQVGTITYPGGATGETVGYSYWPTGQVNAINYSGTATGSVSDTFNLNADQQVSTYNEFGGVNNSQAAVYNNHREVTKSTNPGASAQDVYGFTNTLMTSDQVAGGSTIQYGYNSAEQLVSATNPNWPAGKYQALSYTADGQRCATNVAASLQSTPPARQGPRRARTPSMGGTRWASSASLARRHPHRVLRHLRPAIPPISTTALA